MTFQVLEQQTKTVLILRERNGQAKVLLSKNISYQQTIQKFLKIITAVLY